MSGGGDDESIHAAIAGEGIKRRAGGGGNVWERTQIRRRAKAAGTPS
jgi:hypothetical protein